MAYQMTVTLSDHEYQVLAAEAARRGKPPETVLHDLIQDLQSTSTEKRPLTPEEQAERERLAQLFAGGKPASQMVIEDRGPY